MSELGLVFAVGGYVLITLLMIQFAVSIPGKWAARAFFTAPIWPVWIVVGAWVLVRKLPGEVTDLWLTADWRNRNE